MSEGSCMLSGGDSLKRNRERSVSVSLFSCRLVSQSPILSVWRREGGCLWCLWCLCGVWALSEGSCKLSGGVRIKTGRVKSVQCYIIQLPPCLPILSVCGRGGGGGCLWCLGGVWVLSEGSCELSGGDSIKTRQERSVSVALFRKFPLSCSKY